MIIIGLDLSLSASGWASLIDGATPTYGVIAGKHTGVERLIWCRNRIMDKIDQLKPELVVIEALSFGSKGSAVHEQAGLHFMVRAELTQDGVPHCTVAPNSLKKFCCGSAGSAKNPVKKEHVLRELFRRWNLAIDDNNAADATVLAYIGAAVVWDWRCQIQAQDDVVAKVMEGFPFLRGLRRETVAAVVQAGPQEDLW